MDKLVVLGIAAATFVGLNHLMKPNVKLTYYYDHWPLFKEHTGALNSFIEIIELISIVNDPRLTKCTEYLFDTCYQVYTIETQPTNEKNRHYRAMKLVHAFTQRQRELLDYRYQYPSITLNIERALEVIKESMTDCVHNITLDNYSISLD